ncbi:MAG: DUF3078 domain-containing protein [Bacteroidales bacterium]|nr:DUF3078 domain-containing protein [Bacteroidales bacterium]
MKHSILLLFILLFTSISTVRGASSDSTKHWKLKFETSIGFTQTTLTNWAKGGENSAAVKTSINIFEDYTKGKFTWNNYLGAAYMVQKQQSYTDWRKADDKINLFTKAGIYAWKHWDYTGLLEFKSQFARGFNYPNQDDYTSKFMAPAYFQLAIGLSYKPADYFSVLLSPVGARVTIVNDDTLSAKGAFGVTPGEKSLLQAGASVNALFKKDIFKNVNLMSKLDLFSDYSKRPKNLIDVWIVSWENLLNLKVNKYISMNLATMLIYDDNIPYVDPDKPTEKHGPRTQFMETFTVGFAYSFVR